MFLRRGVWNEERNRQETENRVGRASSEYCKKKKSLEFITHSPYMPNQKGRAQDLHDTKNKQV